MMAGFSIASGDIIINLDDDGQCPMDKLWDLIEPLNNGYDISIQKLPKFKSLGLPIRYFAIILFIVLPKFLNADCLFLGYFEMEIS